MKSIILITLIFIMGCSGYQPPGAREKAGVKKVDNATIMAQDQHKIDSFKAIRKGDFKTKDFSPAKELAISDSIIKLQIEYDSLQALPPGQ